jgi:hypothetical protein
VRATWERITALREDRAGYQSVDPLVVRRARVTELPQVARHLGEGEGAAPVGVVVDEGEHTKWTLIFPHRKISAHWKRWPPKWCASHVIRRRDTIGL